MSHASDRKKMIGQLAGYSLMSLPEVARVLDCDRARVAEMVESGALPSIEVGKREKVDPMDLAVYMLAQREGITPDEYWARYGPGPAAQNARRYFNTIGVFMGAA